MVAIWPLTTLTHYSLLYTPIEFRTWMIAAVSTGLLLSLKPLLLSIPFHNFKKLGPALSVLDTGTTSQIFDDSSSQKHVCMREK
jgi:hypothetical protein